MVDRAEVRRIAALAHLAIPEGDEEALARELSQILSYIDKLSGLDVANVPPTAAPAAEGALRDDEIVPSLPVERALANAPAKVLTAFSVPKILE
jgi:aspartyl-tRNA(Asn)/glutamyl-tRNA(Gln) amidotransferase subunit C